MRTIDFSLYFVTYNFVIGLLLMLSSEKLGAYAGCLIRSSSVKAERLTRIVTLTFGACIASLSASVYLFFHVLRIGL